MSKGPISYRSACLLKSSGYVHPFHLSIKDLMRQLGPEEGHLAESMSTKPVITSSHLSDLLFFCVLEIAILITPYR